jgi:hypothetical protein
VSKKEFLIITGLICILASAPMYGLTHEPLVLVPIVVLFFAVIVCLRSIKNER